MNGYLGRVMAADIDFGAKSWAFFSSIGCSAGILVWIDVDDRVSERACAVR